MNDEESPKIAITEIMCDACFNDGPLYGIRAMPITGEDWPVSMFLCESCVNALGESIKRMQDKIAFARQ